LRLRFSRGYRNPQSSVTINSKTGKTRFYNKSLRAIRGHYFYLKRKLPNRKAVKKIGNHEKLIVNHELHKISKAIVQEAKETNSLIALGKLRGIRQIKNGKSRKFNRKLNNFPYAKLSSYIQYKAECLGIPILTISEAYTSQTCSICGGRGIRHNGLFVCFCGAKNIMKRAHGKLHGEPLSSVGAEVNQPEPFLRTA